MHTQSQQLHVKVFVLVPQLRQRQAFQRPHLFAFFSYPHDTVPHGLPPAC